MMFLLQSLKDASKVKTNKRKVPLESSPLTDTSRVLSKLPEKCSESFTKYKSELDVVKLKQPLSTDNYVERFHHLLCWEEQEHDKILKQR